MLFKILAIAALTNASQILCEDEEDCLNYVLTVSNNNIMKDHFSNQRGSDWEVLHTMSLDYPMEPTFDQ